METSSEPHKRTIPPARLGKRDCEVGEEETGTVEQLNQATSVGIIASTTQKKYRIWLDGGSKGNGDEAYGSYCFLNLDNGRSTIKRLEFGKGTNNDAEWKTLITVLDKLQVAYDAKVELFMDSKLVVNQYNGKWKLTNDRMRKYCNEAWMLRDLLEKRNQRIYLQWIPRKDIELILGH